MNENLQTQIKIIEPVQEYLKMFETVGDFNKYYHKHKEELDVQTTHMLNKKYFINGYRLTRRSIRTPDGQAKNELQVKKVKGKDTSQGSHDSEGLVQRINELESIVEQLKTAFENVDSVLQQVVKHING